MMISLDEIKFLVEKKVKVCIVKTIKHLLFKDIR